MLNPKDLEWLAWNWRAKCNETLYGSRRLMAFGQFNHNQAILPTPAQILNGLVLAQIEQLKREQISNFSVCLPYVEIWKKIFDMVKNVPSQKPLTPKILSNPNHKFVKTLVYIYSMQTFVFNEMNRASRLKDHKKLRQYGPFAAALSFIIHCGNKR